MKKIFLIVFLALLSAPFLAYAGWSPGDPLVPCGPGPHRDPCELCHIFILFENIVKFVLFVLIPPLAALMIVVTGIMLYAAMGDPAKLNKAKQVMVYVVLGLVIMYGAWLIVSLFFLVIGVSDWTGLEGGWFKLAIECPGERISDPDDPGDPDDELWYCPANAYSCVKTTRSECQRRGLQCFASETACVEADNNCDHFREFHEFWFCGEETCVPKHETSISECEHLLGGKKCYYTREACCKEEDACCEDEDQLWYCSDERGCVVTSQPETTCRNFVCYDSRQECCDDDNNCPCDPPRLWSCPPYYDTTGPCLQLHTQEECDEDETINCYATEKLCTEAELMCAMRQTFWYCDPGIGETGQCVKTEEYTSREACVLFSITGFCWDTEEQCYGEPECTLPEIPTTGYITEDQIEMAVGFLGPNGVGINPYCRSEATCCRENCEGDECVCLVGLPWSTVHDLVSLASACPGCGLVITRGTEDAGTDDTAHGIRKPVVDLRITNTLNNWVNNNSDGAGSGEGWCTDRHGAANSHKVTWNNKTAYFCKHDVGLGAHWHVKFQ